jgi:hypothetical protein
MNRLRKTNNQKFRRRKKPQELSFASKGTYFGGLRHKKKILMEIMTNKNRNKKEL